MPYLDSHRITERLLAVHVTENENQVSLSNECCASEMEAPGYKLVEK